MHPASPELYYNWNHNSDLIFEQTHADRKALCDWPFMNAHLYKAHPNLTQLLTLMPTQVSNQETQN